MAGWFMGFFTPAATLVSTLILVTSEAVPAVVAKATMGMASSAVTGLSPLWYGSILSVPRAMAQAALQQSMGEPPPSATAKSASTRRISAAQAFTFSVVGLGRISLNTDTKAPSAACKKASAVPFRKKLLPHTSTPRVPPIFSIYDLISCRVPLPKTSSTGR